MSPRRLFRSSTTARQKAAELDEEIRTHLEMRADDLVRDGWSPDSAWDEALRRFGPLDEARQTLSKAGKARDRRLRFHAFVDGARADLALAVRRARTSPGPTVFAVLTLAMGIALTVAASTPVDRVLRRPLPFPESERLVVLLSGHREGHTFPQVSQESWHDWTDDSSLTSRSAIHREQRVSIRLPEGPARISAQQVSTGFFDVLRPHVVMGRALGPADADEPIAVVSETFWRERMGSPPLPSDLAIVGATFSVVGVVAGPSVYPTGTDAWVATAPNRMAFAGARNLINWRAIARLPDGMTRASLKVELDRIAARVRNDDPSALYSWQVGVEPLKDFLLGDTTRQIWLLTGATAAVWLLAWLNLAGLSLARTEGRAREVAVRLALGAERGRITRQILTEHGLTGLAGGLLGGLLAAALIRGFEPLLANSLPLTTSVRVGVGGLSLALLAGLGTGLLAGLAPAMRAGRMGAAGGAQARRAQRSVGSLLRSRSGRDPLGPSLVVAEVALALTLVVSGALLVQSFRSLVGRDLGFAATDVIMAELPLDLPGYEVDFQNTPSEGVEGRRRFWDHLLTSLSEHGQVLSAGAVLGAPTVGGGTSFIEVQGLDESDIGAGYRAVAGDYFNTLGIERLAGRLFNDSDGAGTERVVIVNRTMAERYWPGRSPLGERVRAPSMEGGRVDEPADWLTVVGVVDDVRTYGFDSQPAAEMFVVAEQVPFTMGAMTLVVRARPGALPGLGEVIREAVADQDPRVPVEVGLLETRLMDAMASRRALTAFIVAFGAIALLLACLGLYGLLAYVVARRTREIGIRAALGAHRARLLAMVLRQSLFIAGAGVGLGGVGAFFAARALQSQLVEVGPGSPGAYLFAAATLMAAATLAALVPAHRAARVDPLTALKFEDG